MPTHDQTLPIDDLQTDVRSKLWIYTNYDCNLSCSYCLVKSSPQTPRQAIGIGKVKRLVDEAFALGFKCIYFTGGEPFVLDEIYEMLAFSSERLTTTVLTNAMLLSGTRLEKLRAILNDNLIIQVSLDGTCPQQHDPYRGEGSWQKTMIGIENLIASGFRVWLSTTETPANSYHLQDICELHRRLGIPEEDHIVRPLAKRGASQEGLDVSMNTLLPEVTINGEGVYWHPISTDEDMLVSRQIFPLAEAVKCFEQRLGIVTPIAFDSLKKLT